MTTETIEQLDSQIARLKPQDQLKLVSLVSARLSTNVTTLHRVAATANQQQRHDFEAMLVEIEATNEDSESDTHIASSLRQMSQERWWENSQLSTDERSQHLQAWLAENETTTKDLKGEFDAAAVLRRIRDED